MYLQVCMVTVVLLVLGESANMCRTAHALLQTIICGIQMLVRVFMTVILMIENLIRMILQTLYNFISFLLQMISLIPICVVFLLTARLKCFMCGGGGPCPANRGGTCDCLMSAVAIIILFFIFRATGVLDKIFYKIGYSKTMAAKKFVPTPGDITECSREVENDTISTDTTTDDLTFASDNYGNATYSPDNANVDITGFGGGTITDIDAAPDNDDAPTDGGVGLHIPDDIKTKVTKDPDATDSPDFNDDIDPLLPNINEDNTKSPDDDDNINNARKKFKVRGSVADIIRHFNLPTESQTIPGDLTTILYYLV